MIRNTAAIEISWRFLKSLDYRYVGLVAIVYSTVVTPMYLLIAASTSNVRQPQFDTEFLSTVGPAFLMLCVVNGVLVLFCAAVASVASAEDRRAVLKASLFLYAPVLVVFSLVWMLRLGFYAMTYRMFWVIYVVFVLLVILYLQITLPVLRTWILRHCREPEKIGWVIAHAMWPLEPDEWEKLEIVIPPTKYFGLLSGLGAILYLIFEALVGEFLSNTLGITGYAGASALAVLVAGVIYPVHSWTSKRVTFQKQSEVEDSDDLIWREIAQKSLAFYEAFFLRHWLAVIVLAAASFALVKLLMILIWP